MLWNSATLFSINGFAIFTGKRFKPDKLKTVGIFAISQLVRELQAKEFLV